MTEAEQKPWYYHRWPWIIIFLLGSSVCMSLYTVYIAVITAEPEITEPYERQ
jgi:hypothetical protein